MSVVSEIARANAWAASSTAPASASRCARVAQAGWNRCTASPAIASSAARPASGPSTLPTAAACATRAPSVGATRISAAWSVRRACQSVPPELARAQWTDWMAASIWKRPARPQACARRRYCSPSAIRAASQRDGSCSSRGTNVPATSRASRRASESEMSAASPSTSGSSGSRVASRTARSCDSWPIDPRGSAPATRPRSIAYAP